MPPKRARNPSQPPSAPIRQSKRLAGDEPSPIQDLSQPARRRKNEMLNTSSTLLREAKEELKTLKEAPQPSPSQPSPPKSPQTPTWSFNIGSLLSQTVHRFTASLNFPALRTPAPVTSVMESSISSQPSPPKTAPAHIRNTRKDMTPVRPSKAQLPTMKKMPILEQARLAYEQKDRKVLKALVRRVILRDVVKKLPEEDHQLAKEWLTRTLKTLKLAHMYYILGNRNVQFDIPKIDDMESIPAHPPWKSGFGVFGLHGGFNDFSDHDQSMTDDELPSELPLVWQMEQLANPPDKRPIKRRKTTHLTSTPPHLATAESSTPRSVFTNSLGASTSLTDFRPRSAVVPSPLFDNGDIEYQGGNVFVQDRAMTPTVNTSDAYDGTFRVPVYETDEWSSSDDEDTSKTPKESTGTTITTPKESAETTIPTPPAEPSSPAESGASTAPAWTQSPPPAPTPAHAELPQAPTNKRKFDDYAPSRPSPLRQHDTAETSFPLATLPSPSDESDQSGSTPTPVRAISEFVFDFAASPGSPY